MLVVNRKQPSHLGDLPKLLLDGPVCGFFAANILKGDALYASGEHSSRAAPLARSYMRLFCESVSQNTHFFLPFQIFALRITHIRKTSNREILSVAMNSSPHALVAHRHREHGKRKNGFSRDERRKECWLAGFHRVSLRQNATTDRWVKFFLLPAPL